MSAPPHPMASTPPNLDPPFKGYIESTFDSLLVFEAARRGMIPRVTRRLIERERGMVQSGAVFVFDEQESGIKRWTDGLVWSPSRILGNFLVYRETDKRSANPPTPISTTAATSNSPNQQSPTSSQNRPGTSGMQPPYAESSQMAMAGGDGPALGQGMLRPRSSSEGGGVDRNRERQLVGSLTNSYKFKEGGLVKKTMSVTVNGYSQHMISYYTMEDVIAGKLRTPSTIPELASLEISPDYLHKQNFRFPPMVEVGPDGVPRYRGEAEEPNSPQTPMSGMSMGYPPGDIPYDPYAPPPMPPVALRLDSPQRSHSRTVAVPMSIPLPNQPPSSYLPPGSAGSAYYDHGGMPPILRQGSGSSISGSQGGSGAMRPGSSSRRYDPYGVNVPASPRTSGGMIGHPHRRQSQPAIPPSHPDAYFAPPVSYDVKPGAGPQTSPITSSHPNPYHYQPPQTAPAGFSEYYTSGAVNTTPQSAHLQSPIAPPAYAPAPASAGGYASGQWQSNPAQTSRLLPANPPSSSESSGSGQQSQAGTAGGEWRGGIATTESTNGIAAPAMPGPPPSAVGTGPAQVWDIHGHGHATGPHGQSYVNVTNEDWRTGTGASLA